LNEREAFPRFTEFNYISEDVGTTVLAAGGETAVSEKVPPQ
jgi:hypothetical protein